jgi:hypothetical protein
MIFRESETSSMTMNSPKKPLLTAVSGIRSPNEGFTISSKNWSGVIEILLNAGMVYILKI